MMAQRFASSFRKIGSFCAFLICCALAAVAGTAAFSGSEISWSMLSAAALLLGVLPLSLSRLVNVTASRQAKVAADPKATLVLRNSALSVATTMWMFAALAASCGFGLASGIEDPATRAATWAGMILLLLLALSMPFFGNRTRIVLSPVGLDYDEFKAGPIAWADIERVELRRVLRSRLIALFLRDEEKYFQRGFKRPAKLLKWTAQLLPSEFSILDGTFDVPPEWLLGAIQVRLDHFGTADSQIVGPNQGVSA